MDDLVELVVIGSGPAGMEAAIKAATLGVNVTLIDSFPKPGGQYFKANSGYLQNRGQNQPSPPGK